VAGGCGFVFFAVECRGDSATASLPELILIAS